MNRRTFSKLIAGLFATPLGFLGGGKAVDSFQAWIDSRTMADDMTATEVLYRQGRLVEARENWRQIWQKQMWLFRPRIQT